LPLRPATRRRAAAVEEQGAAANRAKGVVRLDTERAALVAALAAQPEGRGLSAGQGHGADAEQGGKEKSFHGARFVSLGSRASGTAPRPGGPSPKFQRNYNRLSSARPALALRFSLPTSPG